MAEASEGEEPALDAALAQHSRRPWELLAYTLSIPERAIRSGTGLVGGVLRESAELLVPQSFQTSRTYNAMVQQMLDFLVHDVGGVAQGEKPSSTADIDNYVARKAVGNFVDLASLATLHVSPLLLLAAVSDVAYGSKVYLQELADELKKQGVIDEQSKIGHFNDLLGAVSTATARTSEVFNTPPLSVEALRQSIDSTRAAISSSQPGQVPTQAEVDRMWQEMRDIADQQGVGMLAVGGAAAMHSLGKFGTLSRGALSTVRVAGSLIDRHVLDHYWTALGDIRQKGFYESLSQSSRPYIEAVWTNFHTDKPSLTEDLLSGKLVGNGWRAVRKWLGKSSPGGTEPGPAASDIPPIA